MRKLERIYEGKIILADEISPDIRRCGTAPKHLCVFEFIYFARPDSMVDGTGGSIARQRAGAFLAQEHSVEADVVIGVPDSGLDAALGYAKASGIPYGIGFNKNKYIGRTFISPTQKQREVGVNIKLNPIRGIVEGKRVVLIDDAEKLIANHHTVEEIARIIGVDALGYLSVELLLQIADGCGASAPPASVEIIRQRSQSTATKTGLNGS